MDLKDYIVQKEFLSHNSKRIYRVGDVYNGGDSYHTRQLLRYGFVKEPDCQEVPTADDCEGCRSLIIRLIREIKGGR